MPADAPVLSGEKHGIRRLVLNRPARHNSLVPALLRALNAELDAALARPPRVLVLTGAGRSFSTGGDVRGFAETPRAERRAYAHALVGALHEAIGKLVALPCPVVALVNGPVTGGSLGLVLAADIAVMARGAFIAPYYAEVGFSPDGGWTALLPGRIGIARAAEIQMLNRHVGAEEALALGFVSEIADPAGLADAEQRLIARLLAMQPASLAATKALLWTEARRRRLAGRLESERTCFLALIDRPETEAGMGAFLARAGDRKIPEATA